MLGRKIACVNVIGIVQIWFSNLSKDMVGFVDVGKEWR